MWERRWRRLRRQMIVETIDRIQSRFRRKTSRFEKRKRMVEMVGYFRSGLKEVGLVGM